MPGKLVPTVRTSYSNYEIIKGFIDGWKLLFNEIPRKKSIAVLYGQTCLETGSTASCWNNNMGNVKYAPKNENDETEYMMLSNVWELNKAGKKIIYQPPHPATWFRSFPTLAEGIAFHLDLLKNHRYKTAWAAVEVGSPVDFAHLLKQKGYYTAKEEDYARVISMFYNRFMKDDSYEKIVAELVAPEKETLPEIIQAPIFVNYHTPESQPKTIEDNKSLLNPSLFEKLKKILKVF